MLFILGMDVPNLMVAKASNEGLLQPLSSRSIQHRISLCADDVMLFLRSTAPDLELMVMILNLFGQTSGFLVALNSGVAWRPSCGRPGL
jgi:hypothetical protein